jgi:hypothetical protein
MTAVISTPTLSEMIAARDAGVAWLVERVADDGSPAGHSERNSWWRAPWALCIGGATDAAAAMMGWAEREALTEDGTLRPGPTDSPGAGSQVYYLSPLAIASWLLGRYDTAGTIMGELARHQDPVSGGAYEYRDFRADPLQDTLKTSQLGISALVTGRTDLADGVARWLRENLIEQPDLPRKLFTSRRNGALVSDFPEREAFARVVDFHGAHQAYFQPGIAAAFLAGYSQQTGDRPALDLAHRYLELNQAGGDIQFNDPTSVQICKFGWGAAATYAADPRPELRLWVERMGAWFVDRQSADGSWAPSAYSAPNPGLLDHYWKTAEHVMELSYITTALCARAH